MTVTSVQLHLFPEIAVTTPAPHPAAVCPSCPDLERYTDLTPAQAHNLIVRPRSATAALAAFRRAGWLDEKGTLTESGADVLRRAWAILAGARLPAPVLNVPGT